MSIAARPTVGVLSGLLVVGLVFGMAGCGSAGEGSPADTASRDAPITVEHRFGATELDATPERIVALDPQWTDVLLAVGVDPVGYPVDSLMPQSRAPWQELPATAEALSVQDGLPIEKIAALDPDLIVGTYSIADQNTYRLLSEIAPTIAGPAAQEEVQQVTPWRDLVRIAGEFLAEPETATKVVDTVDRQVSDVAAELPGLEGQTFALAQYVVGDSMYVVANTEDGSSVFFQQLGMEIYPPVLHEGNKQEVTRVNVSTERADLLRSDLLVFLVNGGDESDLADIPGFDQLPGTAAVLDYPAIVALNTPSPLSIPYALEVLRPYLEDVASGAQHHGGHP